MGSDGLFDNVFDDDIEKIINSIIWRKGKRLNIIAKSLS